MLATSAVDRGFIGGVMVSMLDTSAVDRGFNPRSGQTKHYEIGICCLSAKHAALRRKSKDWSARNHNYVSEWSDMSHRGLFFQCFSTIKIQLIIISSKINLFSPWYSWKNYRIGVKHHSLTKRISFFFKSKQIHTFTESKDNNCLILYFE